jgi:hypothetical protein
MEKFFKKIFESKTSKIIISLLALLVLILFAFRAGISVGHKKAMFRCDWGKNYEANFGPARPGPLMREPFMEPIPNAHGSIGKIIKIDLPSMVVLDEKENTEKIVLINEMTEIRKARDSFKGEDLKIDERVVIIGEPNSLGQIEAKFIRLFPISTRDLRVK